MRTVGFAAGDPDCSISVDATLRAASMRRNQGVARLSQGQNRAPSPFSTFSIAPGDLRKKVRRGLGRNLLVFLVDSSDSMGTKERMSAAKGAILALLNTAYQRRDRVSMVSFRDYQPLILLPPTRSIGLARERLRSLPNGGATPLAGGLYSSWRVIRSERIKEPHPGCTLVLISDGEANVPLVSGADCLGELCELAMVMRLDGVRSVVIDTKRRSSKPNEMLFLAEALDARYHNMVEIRAQGIVDAVLRNTWNSAQERLREDSKRFHGSAEIFL